MLDAEPGGARLPAAAGEAAGAGAGRFVVLEHRDAADEGRLVSMGALDEALATGAKVIDDLRRKQAQAVEIDEVDVRAFAGLEAALGGPMRQHIGRRTRNDDQRDVEPK
jgi:hypothetical protein